jgi:hypothetical protein
MSDFPVLSIKLNFDFRSCCKSTLFQQQPTDDVETPVLASAAGGHCSWLHINSASSK